jgi:hypothetical protein
MRLLFWLRRASIVGVALASLNACHGAREISTPEARGLADYKAVVPFSAPRYEVKPDERVSQPELEKRGPPDYPADLLQYALPPLNLTAQVVVGADGKVQRVIFPSGDVFPHLSRFQLAVEKAVLAWSYRPLTFTRTLQSSDRKPVIVTTSRPFSLWYNFHFEVVAGHGVGSFDKR